MHIVFVQDARDGLVPPHRVAEAGVGANGFDVGRGSELEFFAALENVFDGEEVIAAAPVVEAGGMSVAIEDAAIVEIEIAGDVVGAAPMDEGFFDGFEIGMMADGAFAAVAVERSLCG
ncbi:MAG TPA: hypothetical protein VGT03_04020 [Candidatus Acidoferrales bacterium]|nr:hypothetical protein [Candidatus Acidoferrales bacterium]